MHPLDPGWCIFNDQTPSPQNLLYLVYGCSEVEKYPVFVQSRYDAIYTWSDY
jgi:hypothetical protein